ncbi:MAG: hypothetical protein HC927_11870 [Deltaproteobacteria bacterium]|nr:hypothetical protein [Deltaproteobacteria bacterium]
MMALLVDQSRRAATEGPALAAVHRKIGTLLAIDVARKLPVESCEIEHPTGTTTGVRVVPERQPVIIALLRAGLFLAEGIWETLPGSSLLLHGPALHTLAGAELSGRPTVIADAVINTGSSMTPVIERVRELGAEEIMVVALVAYRPTLERMALDLPEVCFTVARLSERSYVGRGGTDTGSRLFGTTRWVRQDRKG